jgi:hypothetical protein
MTFQTDAAVASTRHTPDVTVLVVKDNSITANVRTREDPAG